jgi:hypothetical protein
MRFPRDLAVNFFKQEPNFNGGKNKINGDKKPRIQGSTMPVGKNNEEHKNAIRKQFADNGQKINLSKGLIVRLRIQEPIDTDR